MNIVEKIRLTTEVYVLPFVIGAAFHFFGAWVGIPTLLIGGLTWAGALIKLTKEDSKGDKK